MVVPHDDAVGDLADHLRPIFDSSPDGVYVWLDEEHWRCNDRFAELLGYGSAEELNDTPYLLQRWVHEDDQEMFSWSYWKAVTSVSLPAGVVRVCVSVRRLPLAS